MQTKDQFKIGFFMIVTEHNQYDGGKKRKIRIIYFE